MITTKQGMIEYHNSRFAEAKKMSYAFTLNAGSPVLEAIMPEFYELNALYHSTIVRILGGTPITYDGRGPLPEGVTV